MSVDAYTIEANVIEALKTVFDPEIPVNVWELGLVYGVEVDPDGFVRVSMTLTSPNCPSAEEIPVDARNKILAIPGVRDARVDIVWEPMWTKDMLSEAAKLKLGFF